MAELKLNIVAENLDKLKKKLEGIEIGTKAKGQSSTQKGGGGKGLLLLGGIFGVVVGLLASMEPIVGVLKIIAGLINSLVAPFVPIIVGFLKPFLVLFQSIGHKFLKWLNQQLSGQGKEGGKGANPLQQLIAGFTGKGESFTDKLINVLAVGSFVTALIAALLAGAGSFVALLVGAIGLGAFNLGLWLGDKLAEIVVGTFNFGRWLAQQFARLIRGEFAFQEWLAEHISNLIVGTFMFGKWLKKHIINFIMGTFNFGNWLLEKIIDFIVGAFDFGKWIGQKITDFIVGSFNFGRWLSRNIGSFLSGVFGGGRSRSVNDGVISPSGNIVSTNPRDFLIATKNPSGMGGGKTEININIQGNADQKTVDRVITQLRSELSRRGAF